MVTEWVLVSIEFRILIGHKLIHMYQVLHFIAEVIGQGYKAACLLGRGVVKEH